MHALTGVAAAARGIPAHWKQASTPVFISHGSRATAPPFALLRHQASQLDTWLTSPCVLHVGDRGDGMLASKDDMQALFAFLAPRLHRSNPTLERMAQRGELIEVDVSSVLRDG